MAAAGLAKSAWIRTKENAGHAQPAPRRHPGPAQSLPMENWEATFNGLDDLEGLRSALGEIMGRVRPTQCATVLGLGPTLIGVDHFDPKKINKVAII